MQAQDYATIYHLLEQRAARNAVITEVMLGLSWSSVQVQDPATGEKSTGLCFSPVQAPRNLPWPGTLRGRSSASVLPWLHSYDSSEVCVAVATANAIINADAQLLRNAGIITAHKQQQVPGNLAVFAHFAAQLKSKRVVIIGRYPGLERFKEQFNFQVIERNPQGTDLPEAAANYLLPAADWVFITASALANKTLPHLLWLARNATVVLMGPTLPWLADWADFGVDYLAGVQVMDYSLLLRIMAEGGGTGIFEEAVSYRIAHLHPGPV